MKIDYNHNLVELARKLRNNMTHGEKAVWSMVKGKQINGFDFHRQKPIGNYIADFCCYDLQLVIEVDGITHEEEDVKINDRNKQKYFESIGLNVLRFSDEEVLGNGNIVAKKIMEYAGEFQKRAKKHTPLIKGEKKEAERHTPLPPLDRGGIRRSIAVKAVDNEGLEAIEVVRVKVNGEVEIT